MSGSTPGHSGCGRKLPVTLPIDQTIPRTGKNGVV